VIGRLRGFVAERGSDGSCVIDVGGVGYEVFVPLGSLGQLPDAPAEATLHVHTHVREEAFVLYGFVTTADREAFRTVMGVSGVGPKLALAILSTLNAQGLATAVATQDRTVFKGIPGVGKKTAERLLLELKDKLPRLAPGLPAVVPVSRAVEIPSELAKVSGALVQMGYKPAEAERAVAALSETEGRPVEDLLREALGQLA